MSSSDEDYPSLLKNYKGHRAVITDLEFHPSGESVITSSDDHSVMLWNLKEPNKRTVRFTGHTDAVKCVTFNKRGDIFVTGSKDNTIRLWKPLIRGNCSQIKGHSAAVNSVHFSPSEDKVRAFIYLLH